MKKGNMSAELIRSLVGLKLGIDPTKIILSGEISADYTASNKKHTSANCSWEETTVLYGWFKDSFKEIEEVNSFYITNGYSDGTSNTIGTPLYKVKNIEDAILFVEIYSQPVDGDWVDEYRVYKPADFAGKLAQVTQEDIARWENWLTNE